MAPTNTCSFPSAAAISRHHSTGLDLLERRQCLQRVFDFGSEIHDAHRQKRFGQVVLPDDHLAPQHLHLRQRHGDPLSALLQNPPKSPSRQAELGDDGPAHSRFGCKLPKWHQAFFVPLGMHHLITTRKRSRGATLCPSRPVAYRSGLQSNARQGRRGSRTMGIRL